MNDAEKINVTILEEWIAGRGKHPVTWRTLTEILQDTGLNVLAGEIADVKFKAAHCQAQSSELECCSRILLLYRNLWRRSGRVLHLI